MPIVNWIDVSYGDEVAILPYFNCPPVEVLGIQVVEDIGSAFIELSEAKIAELAAVRDGNTSSCRDGDIGPCFITLTEQRLRQCGSLLTKRSRLLPHTIAVSACSIRSICDQRICGCPC